MEIKLNEIVGEFAENKDLARDIRLNIILPALERNEKVILDFENVKTTTQSFVHALISDLIRKRGIGILDNVYFKNCNEIVRKIISIVTEYMQDSSIKT